MKKGLLLINIGTPRAPTFTAVWRYLGEFLSDKRVIDLPLIFRYLLVYGLILPFRTQNSTQNYQKIWQPQGSPLLDISQNLIQKLQAKLDENWQVVLGMRYGSPSIKMALDNLKDCDLVVVLPLYPQYASSSTESAIEKVSSLLRRQKTKPTLFFVREFFNQDWFIKALAITITPYLQHHDFFLFSYHGLPVRHLEKEGCQSVCEKSCPPIGLNNQRCYRAQCQQTTAALALQLKLPEDQYAFSFQSRLGKTPWIRPYTDEYLVKLREKGIKRLAVACPSFVTDCLETLEEIGIRAKEQWHRLGGEQFTLIPALNTTDLWITGLSQFANSASYAIENT